MRRDDVNIQGALFADLEQPTTKVTARDNNAVALFALSQIRGVGFVTIKTLCDEFKGNLADVFRSDKEKLGSILYDARTPNATGVLEEIKGNGRSLVSEGRKTWNKYASKGVSLIFRNDSDYPAPLLDLVSPPSWLFIEGDATLLNSPFLVGFVGTRAPSEHGEFVARRASAHLARLNSVILSGLAEGIDAVGHQTAILYGSPTVAVLGHGIDVIFPASTAKIRQDIVLFGGAVISEYLPGDNYSRDKFVHRNRIQAALSKAVCFVEAREKSGTAHTLKFAHHLNRPIFGVVNNGFIGSPEEELLHVLQNLGGSIFDIGCEHGTAELYEFVHRAFTQDIQVPADDAPKMFRNIAREVRRLAEDYGASRDDLSWLLKELGKITVKDEIAPALTSGTVKPRTRRAKSADKGSNS